MIDVIQHHKNLAIEPQLIEWVAEDFSAVQKLMPELPKKIKIYFDQDAVVPDYPTGGYAYSPTVITIGFDDTFGTVEIRRAGLRATVYHESYHLAQGFTFFDASNKQRPVPTAVEEAVGEGAATVFEREYADSRPGWSKYLDDETMLEWFTDIKKLGNDYDIDKWKFYDPETDQKWMLYRTGVFIVDKALRNSGLDILDIRHKPADEVLKLANL